MSEDETPEWLLNLRLKRAGLKYAALHGLTPLRLVVEHVYGGPVRPGFSLKSWPVEKRAELIKELKQGLNEMTKDEVQKKLDAAITKTSGRPGPFADDAKIADIMHDSLETMEAIIALEVEFDKTFDDSTDAPIHLGTYGELLDLLCTKLGVQ